MASADPFYGAGDKLGTDVELALHHIILVYSFVSRFTLLFWRILGRDKGDLLHRCKLISVRFQLSNN